MTTTFKIARTELSLLFYSPIAWFLLVVFMFQCGLSYTDGIDSYLISQELGGAYAMSLRFLTQNIIGYPRGLFAGMVGSIYLYLPLITMGLISRELSSGTIKLLYSSPTRVREIVAGKFLAMMVFCLLLTAVLAVFAFMGIFNIRHADLGLMVSGLLGIYLLMCTYAAIGLFMSCLTSYQIVAAICTLALFGALQYVGRLWQDIDFVRDLTQFISISGRTEKMLLGLITTKDILYFMVIIAIFLGMSVYKLRSSRRTIPLVVRISRYALIVVIAVTVGFIGSLPALVGYLDLTATKSMTLTANAQKIIKSLDGGPVKVTSYINLLEQHFWYGAPSQRNYDVARWEPYIRFKHDIGLKYVYYYDSSDDKYLYKYNKGQSLQQIADKYITSGRLDPDRFLQPKEIRSIIDLGPEQRRYVMKLDYKNRSTYLRLFNDQLVFPSETETSAAIKRLTGTPPHIAFADGQLERSIERKGDREYQTLTSEITFRNSLVNQGFDVLHFNPAEQDVPAGIAGLVIADPKMPFDSAALGRIRRYIDQGGNLLIAGEPGKQALLNPLLQPLGVQMMDGVLVQQSEDFAPDLVLPYLTDTAAALSRALAFQFEDSTRVSMPGVAGLRYVQNGSFAIHPLLMTDGSKTWNKKGKLVTDSARILFHPEEGDEKGAFATALQLTRQINGRQQRIVVTGDADFLDNSELGRHNVQTANFSFNTAVFGWYTYGAFPIDSSRPKPEDTHLNLTKQGFRVLKILCLGILPAILLVLGAILLIRRKRK
jgi:ABC-2 type transport system permease protein